MCNVYWMTENDPTNRSCFFCSLTNTIQPLQTLYEMDLVFPMNLPFTMSNAFRIDSERNKNKFKRVYLCRHVQDGTNEENTSNTQLSIVKTNKTNKPSV